MSPGLIQGLLVAVLLGGCTGGQGGDPGFGNPSEDMGMSEPPAPLTPSTMDPPVPPGGDNPYCYATRWDGPDGAPTGNRCSLPDLSSPTVYACECGQAPLTGYRFAWEEPCADALAAQCGVDPRAPGFL